jgi:hypothetical protein
MVCEHPSSIPQSIEIKTMRTDISLSLRFLKEIANTENFNNSHSAHSSRMFGVCVTSFLALSDHAAVLNSSAGGVNDFLLQVNLQRFFREKIVRSFSAIYGFKLV